MKRKISDLHPRLAPLCEELLRRLKSQGVNAIVTCTLRDSLHQAALHAQGRQSLLIVNVMRRYAGLPDIGALRNRTVTDVLTSYHMFGLAFDIAILDAQGNPTWEPGADINDNAIPDYEEAGRIGESLGLKWGGRFHMRDLCHFQLTGGLTIAQLLSGMRPDFEQKTIQT